MVVNEYAIKDLKPYERNAKKHSKTQIANVAESIRRYGFVQPVVIDAAGVIVIGHCRVLAAQSLGMATVPCVLVDQLTPEQVRELRLLDNKTNESEWDLPTLQAELQTLDLSGYTLDWGLDLPEAELEEDEPPDIDLLGEPKTHRGEVWQLGQHFLMCGDATVRADVERLMAGRKADMLLTDPPYNVSYEGTAGTMLNDKQLDDQFRQFLLDAFKLAKEALVPGGAFYIWHADTEGYNFRGACRDAGLRIRECLIWVKNSLVLGRQDYHWQHEPCLYGESESDADQDETHDPCLYGWKEGSAHTWRGDRKQTTVLHFDRPTKSAEHPTMKPVKLCGYLIKNSCPMGSLVLDTFGGSGSTLMACEQLGRECRMMELDPRYVDVIIKRWEAYTNKIARRLP